MMKFLSAVFKFLSGGVLDRALDTIDKKIENETDRQKLRADVIMTHMKTRGDFLRSGGFFLTLLFAIPTVLHYTAVVIYSILWCAGCAYPQEWTIAALPPAEAEYARWTALACLGVIGMARLRR